jgi:hypothetical protein
VKAAFVGIWILAAVVILSTLDTHPDPPASIPRGAQCKILQLHDQASANITVIVHSNLNFISDPPPTVAEEWEPHRPTDILVLRGNAADSSPPILVLSPSETRFDRIASQDLIV